MNAARDGKTAPYPLSAYDEHFCLKPGFLLWLAAAFLARPYVVMIISFTRRGDRMELIDLVYASRPAMALAALASLPALAFVYAYARRRPDAAPRDRLLWRRGRWLLLASALVHLAIVGERALHHLAQIEGWRLLELVLSLMVAAYLLFSRRVRDTFAEYPEPPAPDAPRRRPGRRI